MESRNPVKPKGKAKTTASGVHHLGVSKNRGILPPKWMVKIMENPMNKWMIWGYHYFWKHPFLAKFNLDVAPSQDAIEGLGWDSLLIFHHFSPEGKMAGKKTPGFKNRRKYKPK